MEAIPASEPEFAAFVAIDWADKEHVWALQVAGASRRETGKFEHTPEAIEMWAAGLATRFGGRPVAIALEQARGALVYALSQYSHLVLYPIPSTAASRYRAAIFPSGSKDDPKDADLLLDLLVQQRGRWRVLKPDTELTRKLQGLVEKRRQLVDLITAQTNRITDLLKIYFPQVLTWFDEVKSALVGAFLERWPTLPQLQAEQTEVLRKFFHQHNCRSQKRIEERLAEIQKARPAITDPAVIEPAVMMAQALLRAVAVLREDVTRMEKAIQEAASAHPDYSIFNSFPGAGPVMTPRLLVAFGSQRDRYSSAGQVQCFSGIAPVMQRSGATQYWVHFRWACPKFLRQSFHEFAELSIPHCGWAREFYDQQRKQGKSHHAAVRALAFKWIRILFRCWQSGTPYQEDLYVRAREKRAAAPEPQRQKRAAAPEPQTHQDRRRHSAENTPPSFAAQLGIALGCGSTVDFQFKKLGGFWKFSHSGS